MATKEELQAIADQEIEDAKPLNKSVNGVVSEFSDDDYAQAKIDLGNSKWNAQQFGYIEARQNAYPPITDQLDEIYHNGIDAWKVIIKKVKDDNPKPS